MSQQTYLRHSNFLGPDGALKVVQSAPAKAEVKDQAYLIQNQTVTSHGHETVSDYANPTNVAHSPGVAILTPHNWDADKGSTNTGRVHVPIHNPPSITTSWVFDTVYIKFASEEGATVEKIGLYHDSDLKISVGISATSSFHIQITGTEAKIAHDSQTGLSLALDLAFPKEKSAIKLSSVSIIYKAVAT